MNFKDGLDVATVRFFVATVKNCKGGLSCLLRVYNERRLQELGNRLKMNNIAFDKGKSHVVYVPSACSICKAILSSPFFPRIGQAVRRLATRGTIFTGNGDQGSTKQNGCYIL
nr:hypothetical protein [Tanacetum cinerariifolium]